MTIRIAHPYVIKYSIADCAFFINNKAVFASDKGAVFQDINIDLSLFEIIIIHPNFSVSTAEAYSGIKPKNPKESIKNIIKRPISEWKNTLINDFEEHLFKKYTILPKIKKELYQQGAIYAAMSGSGSAIFGIFKKIPKELKEASKIDVNEYQKDKWYLNVWNITNVLPINNRLEKGIAAFPEEIPYRLIKLFSYKGEVVLDPFMGSGTTLKVAIQLGRKAVGYEIDIELLEVVKKKLGINQSKLVGNNEEFEIIIRDDVKHLRTKLQERVKNLRSVTKSRNKK